MRIYFDAIAGQDKETARALLVSDTNFRLELEDPDSPFRTWTSATHLEIEGPKKERFCEPGETCVRMYVSFDLDNCILSDYPGGLRSEPFVLRLVNGRWLIRGHGEG
ncbi:hypothetical protein JOL79_08765 [Microbispora sp. RL4-1S]|uniref:Uncharacterized protein n=1 Tax=Microbispora oryzae TaxID=2806554 RepID=A0A940WIJ8_9ACTN|nr:hypothetical protein [Microbispora oryzae]MBP2703897.1 hypothetical protein [Microbispora oryzae]